MAVINGIRAIAIYLQVSEVTVREYIEKYGLPIRKIGNAQNAPVITTSEMVDVWVRDGLLDLKMKG